jgi:uncharacterized iron-regulated membrane protein
MDIREIIGLLMAFLALAGLSMAIVNGDKTAAVMTSFANGFSTMVKASTLQG